MRAGGACSCLSRTCGTPGKHLRSRRPTREAATIRAWWRRWPGANVGLPTGPENGLVVIDVDPYDGGHRSLGRLLRAHGPLPPTAEVRTGSGGRHVYFRHPGVKIAGRNGWRPGIDIRGDGGYVVAPPSIHESGRRYEWLGPPRRPAPLPPWLLALLRQS